MNADMIFQRHWHVVRFAVVMILIAALIAISGLMPASGTSARQTTGSPTISSLFVNSFDCETGALGFRATVANLPHVPAGSSPADDPLAYTYTARYAEGPDISQSQPSTLSPTAEEAPYTGNVFLALTVPLTNDQGPITSILIRVSVGFGGAGQGAIDNATNTSQLTYIVGCEDDPSGNDLAGELVEALKRILRDILTVG